MNIFNKTNIAALFISSSLVLTSCESVQNANNQQKGTVIGTAAGAVIGGVLGGATGYTIGRSGDRKDGRVK